MDMKYIALDITGSKLKLLISMLVMLTLVMFSFHSTAAQTDAADTGDKTSAQRFDHTATGYTLTGSHSTIADCGSCHVGGVFKGTPHNCIGCHTKGQRVVALTMSSNHLATTQPCDICHTSTVTFLGARYNHGMAIPGQCGSCHNGSIAPGRPASHAINQFKATYSCDNCHRPTIWLPSFWNHTGVTANCVSCHGNAAMVGDINTRHAVGGTSPEGYAHNPANNSIGCESCHHTFTNWYGAAFDHVGATGTCFACHNGVRATPATQVAGTTSEAFAHNSSNGGTGAIDCGSCHSGYSSWLGALYNHAGAAGTCLSCHNSTRATGTAQFSGHVSIGTSDCSTCHTGTTTWLGASGGMPSNHMLFTSGTACAICHSTTVATGAALHSYLSSSCKTCHDSSSPVYAWTNNPPQRVSLGSHHGSSATQDCTSCHSTSYTQWNHP